MTPRRLSVSSDDLAPVFFYIQSHFYRNLPPKRYYQDRHMLLHALCWPAAWLHQRRLLMRQAHYQQWLIERLRDIHRHGQPHHYQPYFPRYLLKCLQQWIDHQGDKLYDQLKSASYSIDWILEGIERRPPKPPPEQSAVEILAQTHHILSQSLRRKSTPSQAPSQLNLF